MSPIDRLTASYMPHVAHIMKGLTLMIALLVTALPSAAETRVISTDAGTTEILIALNQQHLLVGVDVTSSLPEGLDLPSVGYHRALPAEGLLSLKPTLVFGSEHMAPKETLTALKALDVPVIQHATATNAEQLKQNIQAVAKALNVDSSSALKEVEKQQSILQMYPYEASSSVFLLSMQGKGMRQAGKGTAGHAFLSLLGLPAQANYQGYRSISEEALLTLQPEVIVIAAQGDLSVEQVLKNMPALAHTPAAAQHRIVIVDASSLVAGISLSALQQASAVAAQLNASS